MAINPVWKFIPSANKPSSNEGDHIATYESPIWSMKEGSNIPITPTHNPCGYWTKDYVPPSPSYFYIGESVSPIRIARISRSAFTFVDYASFSTAVNGGFSRMVLRRINNRNIAYKDADGNIYSGGGNGSTPGKIVKFNLGTMVETGAVAIDTAVNRPVYEGVIDSTDQYSYWINQVSTGEKRFQKIDMTNFSLVTAITGDYGGASIEIDETNNRLYAIRQTYDPYYFRISRFSISPFVYVDSTANLVAGGRSNTFGSECLTKVGTKILWVGYSSTTINGPPGRLVRANLPDFDAVSSIVFDSDEGYGIALVVDSAGQYAYVFTIGSTKYFVIKFDITTTPMIKIGRIEVFSGGIGPGALGIDESGGYIYFSDTNLMGKIYRASINPFAYVGYMNVISGHYPYIDIFFED